MPDFDMPDSRKNGKPSKSSGEEPVKKSAEQDQKKDRRKDKKRELYYSPDDVSSVQSPRLDRSLAVESSSSSNRPAVSNLLSLNCFSSRELFSS